MNINKNKFALGVALALSVMALNQSFALADDPIQDVAALSVKYDVDYMDEGVRVIIPKLLPELKIKDGERLDYKHKYYAGKDQTPTATARGFDDSVASAYKSLGFDIGYSSALHGGTEVNQFLAFPLGNLSSLDKFNKNFGKANFIDTVKTIAFNTVGVVGGAIIGGAVGGTGGAIQGSVGSLGRDSTGNFNIKNAKSAVFDGYQNLPAKADDNIVIYGVATQGGKSSGNVIFITSKAEVDEAVVIRGVIKAQNISQ